MPSFLQGLERQGSHLAWIFISTGPESSNQQGTHTHKHTEIQFYHALLFIEKDAVDYQVDMHLDNVTQCDKGSSQIQHQQKRENFYELFSI